jgi:tripartite-type tricarboxylate transporter receptor subunit TctC
LQKLRMRSVARDRTNILVAPENPPGFVVRYEFVTWFGIVASNGTPASVIAILARHIRDLQEDPAVKARLIDSGLEPLEESPEEFGARIRRDHERFRDIVNAAGLKPE